MSEFSIFINYLPAHINAADKNLIERLQGMEFQKLHIRRQPQPATWNQNLEKIDRFLVMRGEM